MSRLDVCFKLNVSISMCTSLLLEMLNIILQMIMLVFMWNIHCGVEKGELENNIIIILYTE